jgi:8-oxo-dGTP pyrophosphatase MutT (NUDIX family)
VADRPTHAGGVVYRIANREPEFLLVTARRAPHIWVYPKGHIEPGESPEDAAVREVREEAGVTARIVGPIDDVAIEVAGERQRIRYFLMRAEDDGDGAPGEGRRSCWVTAGEALRRLPHATSQAVLRKALAGELWHH